MSSPQRANTKKFLLAGVLTTVLLMLLVVGGVAYWLLRPNPSAVAQAKLDRLLGKPGQQQFLPQAPLDQNDQDQADQAMRQMMAQEAQRDQAQMDMDLRQAQNLFGQFNLAPQPAGGVSVQETDKAYELRVPVQNPEDAQNVSVQVDPHRIQISGKITYRSPDGHQTGSSSFMQMFPTTSEVLPEKVTRAVQGKGADQTLLVTIPKKYPGKAPEPVQPQDDSLQPAPSGTPAPQVSPDVIRQLRQSNPRFI